MAIKYKSGSSWVDIRMQIFPVGSIYMSMTSTSPSSLFGGTWAAITGRFLYCNAGTSTGGSNTHTLVFDEMPSHNHGGGGRNFVMDGSATGGAVAANISVGGNSYVKYGSTATAGNSQPHNNMPAYQTVYCWRRTA